MRLKTKNKKPSWSLLVRDCCEVLPSIDPKAALIVADPPYNFGMNYSDYDDNQTNGEYAGFMEEWLAAAYNALTKHGTMWVFAPDEWVSFINTFCQKNLGLHRRNWIVWIYTFGQAAKKAFTRSHTHLLYFTKSKKDFTYNTDTMKVPSARQLVYNDKRAASAGKQPDDTWCLLNFDLEKAIRADGDVWLQSRVCGTYRERQAHSPNQIPLPIMERIIKATSNPGDLVVDPFLGSGTTGVAAVRLGRKFIGMDVSAECVNHSIRRIQKEGVTDGNGKSQ